jgi:hypothetical protein
LRPKNAASARSIGLTCPDQVLSLRLNPIDYMALDVVEVSGVPVVADETVLVKHARLQCPGDHQQIERALAAFLEEARTLKR